MDKFEFSILVQDDTPDLRRQLEQIGYENTGSGELKDGLVTLTTGKYLPIDREDYPYWKDRVHVIILRGETLFLALAALTTDPEYQHMQWFVRTSDHMFIQCNSKKTAKEFFGEGWSDNFHKASVEELLKEFAIK